MSYIHKDVSVGTVSGMSSLKGEKNTEGLQEQRRVLERRKAEITRKSKVLEVWSMDPWGP